jgi:glutathione-regulated potassium-efflux system protein KefB
VLVIGFGRFGQVASQSLLAGGMDVSIIDNNADMIRNAERFGFKVYYGDGTRLDVLQASGAEKARAVLVCIDDPQGATRITELVRSAFPNTVLMVRAYDRAHARELVHAGVDVQVRESFESAMLFGRRALELLGVNVLAAQTVSEDIRTRDAERFALEVSSNDDRPAWTGFSAIVRDPGGAGSLCRTRASSTVTQMWSSRRNYCAGARCQVFGFGSIWCYIPPARGE